jgi:hypothetical protein
MISTLKETAVKGDEAIFIEIKQTRERLPLAQRDFPTTLLNQLQHL